MALLGFLLPIFFIFLGFGEVLRINLSLQVSSGLIDLVILVIIFIWLFFIKKNNYELGKAFLIFFIFALISLLINILNYTGNQLLISSMYLVRFTFYASLYFVFVDIGRIYKSVIPKLMFFSGLIFLLVGLFQFFLFKDLRQFYYLGWDLHLNRLFSTFFDPNFAGAFLVLILIFSFILKDIIFPKDWKIVPYIFLIINFLAIILTYSRGAYLMLFISILAYSFITGKWKILIGFVVSLILIFIILSPKFELESTNLLRTASIEKRLESTNTAISIWRDSPMGVGFNTYRYARESFDNNANSKGNRMSNAGAGVDNSFVFVLVTAGILGFLSYAYLIFKILKLGYRNMHKNKYAMVLIISAIGLVANSFTLNSLFYSFLMLWMFVLVGFTESSLHE